MMKNQCSWIFVIYHMLIIVFGGMIGHYNNLIRNRKKIINLLQWLEDVFDVGEDEDQVDLIKVSHFPLDCYRRVLEYFKNRFQYLAQKYEYETNWVEGGDQMLQPRLLLLNEKINVTKNFIKDAEVYFEEKMQQILIIRRV